jgi:hypothetical protein
MFTKLLFGVQNSPQRKICVVLAIILIVLGIIVIPVQGSAQGMSGVFLGISFTLVGLFSVAVLSRVFASHDEKVATSEQLGRLTGDYDAEALKHMVEHAPHDPNDRMGTVTGQLDAADIKATVDQVRRDADAL